MVKVNERRTLHDVLKEPKFVIPEIPGLFVLSHWCLFSNSCYRVRLPSLMSLSSCVLGFRWLQSSTSYQRGPNSTRTLSPGNGVHQVEELSYKENSIRISHQNTVWMRNFRTCVRVKVVNVNFFCSFC